MKRTTKQNSSLHLYCQQLAFALNEAGIPQEVFYKGIQADYTMESIKGLFRKYGETKYLAKSTTELTTKEIQDIYEEINRHTSQFGIHIPWPSEEELYYKNIK